MLLYHILNIKTNKKLQKQTNKHTQKKSQTSMILGRKVIQKSQNLNVKTIRNTLTNLPHVYFTSFMGICIIHHKNLPKFR